MVLSKQVMCSGFGFKRVTQAAGLEIECRRQKQK